MFGRSDSEEVPEEVAYSMGRGRFGAAMADVESIYLDFYIVSLRLGQRPSDMRGRMSLFRTWGMGVFGSIRRVAQEDLPVAVGV